jgi:glycosyltransferase involved in cell wall biosynthesis
MLESAPCAVPVVAFDVGGVPEIARHELNARLVSVGDVEGLRNGIRFFQKNRDSRAGFGRAGREIAVGEFSLDKQAGRWTDYLSRLAGLTKQTRRGELQTS